MIRRRYVTLGGVLTAAQHVASNLILSPEEALLNIHHLGSVSQLSRALAQSDMTLVDSQGAWSLTTASRP